MQQVHVLLSGTFRNFFPQIFSIWGWLDRWMQNLHMQEANCTCNWMWLKSIVPWSCSERPIKIPNSCNPKGTWCPSRAKTTMISEFGAARRRTWPTGFMVSRLLCSLRSCSGPGHSPPPARWGSRCCLWSWTASPAHGGGGRGRCCASQAEWKSSGKDLGWKTSLSSTPWPGNL